jgi:hypothetical protein
VAIVLLVVVHTVSTASASGGSAQDKTATDAYLAAGYAYARATLANAQVSRAAVEGLAGKLGSECPGVLKGAPPEPSSSTPFARRVGESKREDEQLSELESELGHTLRLTLEQSDRQALLAFAGTVRSLHWRNPTLTHSVIIEVAEFEEQLALPIPNVCGDMRAWVSSG